MEKKIIPLISRIISLMAEDNYLIYCIPRRFNWSRVKNRPFLTRGDRLVGRILGHPWKITRYISKNRC